MGLHDDLKQQHAGLSRTLQKASAVIIRGLADVPFQSIRELATLTGVSPLSIIRLTRKWGYSGYPAFQRAVRANIYATTPSSAADKYDNGASEPTQWRDKTHAQIAKVAARIHTSRQVHIAGFRSAQAFASYMNYMGRMVFDNFHLMTESGLASAQDLAQMSPADTLITFSTTPYSSETVRLVQAAQSLNIPTVAITDDILSPFGDYADLVIDVPISKTKRLFEMAPMISTIEHILETSFDMLGEDADARIAYFGSRIAAIKGYW
ncbi:MurR/RpiR family transcriptional regulator [Candidatus Puniceispirillum sp.]|uniref:MurR/RpiR family transcriptional regulator n=1 Tax=Candidatus Puniceispirillum sp. TaxID=2026719 RepID=UPI003F69ED9C